ncbi:uncharacterized protein LOC134828757 [Culicoides brevitarsis]|uniref:uncharacterized protein LOC134828757 n=1 Tax=Culicoides brevitarsis TaxID=469753 RepID=UPI00307BCB8F
MDTTEKNDSPNIGSLFQQIVNDLKSTNPLWDDFVLKANKLHFCLKATIQALVFYLEAFQKIADAATNSKGASKEIGTALTRVCLRHKAVESRLKTFTTAIMECLIIPLQEKIEDWKKQVTVIEKERAKESKRCRLELKKSSTGTLRLQKKAKKGQTNIQSLVDSSMQDYNQRQAELDEIERKSLRAIMIEERMRYCTFVFMLQPVVKEECEVMYELGHLQEVMQSIGNVTKEPHALPQSSEQFIQDSNMSLIFYPDSPGGSNTLQPNCSSSIGSRKSSVCSINSMNSNSSGSPGHQKSTSQFVSDTRLKAGKSEDSGFRSSSTMSLQVSTGEIQSQNVSTWPPQVTELPNDNRPHTISTAYEKGHARPPLTVYTFQNPDSSESRSQLSRNSNEKGQTRPPLPIRCSSLERPISTVGLRNSPNTSKPCPSPIPLHVTKDYFQTQTQPTYANMTELTTMTSTKNTNSTTISPLNIVNHQPTSPVHSTSSLVSPDSCATNPVSLISSPDISAIDETPQCTPQTSCPQTPTVLEVDKVKAMSNIDNSFVENKDNLSEPTKYSGSVLAKATLFEQLEKKQLQDQTQLQNVISRSSISTNYSNMKEGKKEEIFKSMSALESSGAPTRIARRSSVNIIKPQPPVRRSSSVTPCQESLPPPPSYLLEKNQQLGGNVAGTVRALNEMRHTPASPNVIRKTQQVTFQAEQLERKQHQETLMTYKQPHIITSFSPKYDAPKVGMFSYQLSPTSQEKSKGSGIYARPQINLGTSSFKQSGHGIFSQIAKRINPNKSNQFDSNTFDTLNQRSSNNPEKNDQHHDKQQHMNDSHQNQQVCGNNYYGTTLDDQHSKTTQIQRYDVSKYASTNPFISSITSQSSARSQPHPYNFTTSSNFQNHQSENVATQHSSNNITVDRPNTQTGSVIAKTNAGFLENLNQKLAEQRLSGKAYAVRNYINKTALPDPRVCHESLLDQIKRGAILKRNRTVNDRSAPNII